MPAHARVPKLSPDRPAAEGRQRELREFADRLLSLEALALPTQETLDRYMHLAGIALDVPIACVSLVDPEQQLRASSYGTSAPTALLLSYSIWKRVITAAHPIMVEDGLNDPVALESPAVRDGTVRAYLGVPLLASDGRAIGSVLALDRRPRPWTADQVHLLRELSFLILSQVELGAIARQAARHNRVDTAPAARVGRRRGSGVLRLPRGAALTGPAGIDR
ncbi:MAG: GAF domain-containing protein [Gemmatimonadetes bacterium]|nr:GAF domain-containing protein [Gemmatimonadota bacterium]